MRYFLFVMSLFTLSQWTCHSSAFLMIPFCYHGKWIVAGENHGEFVIEQERVLVTYKSAKLLFKPVLVEDKNIHLHGLEVVSRPSILDMKQIWRGISYFHALQSHGILIETIRINDEELEVKWYISTKYAGIARLCRIPKNT